MFINEQQQVEILAAQGQRLEPGPQQHPHDFEPCEMCWGSGETNEDINDGTCPRCQGYSVEPQVIVHPGVGGHWHLGYGGDPGQPVFLGPARKYT